MRCQERGSSAATILVDSRARTEHRDAAVGERIFRAALGHQQGRALIPLQIPGVFGQSAIENHAGVRRTRW